MRRGRTPNPDVLCNREIKFGTLWKYARRLGGKWLATGHYARLKRSRDGRVELHKGKDPGKDQSYFLHALEEDDFSQALFPLGEILKGDVRKLARDAGLPVAEKKDSTGICFVGERPFSRFIGEYLPTKPGAIKDPEGRALGKHQGLAFYTLGQRRGLGIGGQADCPEGAWYVARKDLDANELIVVQGTEHPALYQDQLTSGPIHWINEPPPEWSDGLPFACGAKDPLPPARSSLYGNAPRPRWPAIAVRAAAARSHAGAVRSALSRLPMSRRRDDRNSGNAAGRSLKLRIVGDV